MDFRLRHARKSKGYSRTELARLLEVSPNSITNWEAGRCMPPFETVVRISRLLEVSIDYLAGITDQIAGKHDPSQLLTIEQLPILHDMPVWLRNKAVGFATWAFVDGITHMFKLPDGTRIAFDGFNGDVFGYPPAFSLWLRGIGQPLSLEELRRLDKVWVEPISQDGYDRLNLRGWYRPSERCVINEAGMDMYYFNYGAKWLAFTDILPLEELSMPK